MITALVSYSRVSRRGLVTCARGLSLCIGCQPNGESLVFSSQGNGVYMMSRESLVFSSQGNGVILV